MMGCEHFCFVCVQLSPRFRADAINTTTDNSDNQAYIWQHPRPLPIYAIEGCYAPVNFLRHVKFSTPQNYNNGYQMLSMSCPQA